MSIHRYQSTWRSITFNPHLDNSGLVDDPAHIVKANLASRYILDSVDINKVSVQDYRELRQFLEGAEPNEAYEGVRAINGQGRIQGSSPDDLEDKAWALNEAFSVAACRIAAANLTPKGVLPFSFRRAHVGGALQLRFWARPGPGRPIWIGRRAEGLIRPFSFQLIAFDPFAYDETATSVSPSLAGGNVTNPGNIYTRPTISISQTLAGAANFTITNTTTGKSLVLDLTSPIARRIDVRDSTLIRILDGTNRYADRVSGFISDMVLAPGVNAFTFANTTNITAVTFDFRGAYA